MKLQIEQSWKKVLRVKTKTKNEKKLLKNEKNTTFINENSKFVQTKFRSSPPAVFSGKVVLKI